MKQIIKDYFTFNKRERNGVLTLLGIIVVLLVLLQVLSHLDNNEQVDFSEFEKEVDEFLTAQNNNKQTISSYKTSNSNLRDTPPPVSLFPFNPNNLTSEQWKQLGLKEWQIKIIHNYEVKGGKFYKKEDLKKIYGIDDKLYAQLESYISIPKQSYKTKSKKAQSNPNRNWYSEKKAKPLIIELNTADTTELKNLKGIGSTYSKRIIKYRDLLGGFVNIEQMKEVYGVKAELVEKISKQLSVDASGIKKLNVNTSTAAELKKHPYINWNVANGIANYRKQHGEYKALEEIKKSHLINNELYVKIAPYLKLK